MINRDERKALNSLKYLWRVDDPEWLTERKGQWRTLQLNGFKDCERDELKKYADYFVYGKLKGYIHGATQHILTPHTTAEESKQVFDELVTDSQEKKSILSSSHLSYVTSCADTMPWIRKYVRNYINGVLGPEYHVIKVVKNTDRKVAVASEGPSSWVFNFMLYAMWYVEGEEDCPDYHAIVDCYDYFMTMRPFASDAPKGPEIMTYDQIKIYERFKTLYEVVEETLEEGSDRPLVMELANKLANDKDKIMELWELNADVDQVEEAK